VGRFFLGALGVLLLAHAAPASALDFVRLPDGAARFSHAPGVISLSGGALMACWYSGSGERSPDTVVRCAREESGGRDWRALPVAVRAGEMPAGATAPDRAVGNVVLARDLNGRVILIYGVVQGRSGPPCRGWKCGGVNFKISSDEGKTWSAPVRLEARLGMLPRAGVLHEGARDLLPLYREGRGSSVIGLSLSGLDDSLPEIETFPIPTRDGLIQPSLAKSADGTVFAFLRDQKRKGVFVSRFRDGAWSSARKTNLPNPGAAVEAFSDAAFGILLIYNPSSASRSALSLARTRDGETFDGGCTLTGGANFGAVAYPSVTRIDDNHWALVFSARGKAEIMKTTLDRATIARCVGG
jgi:hypothetical protein